MTTLVHVQRKPGHPIFTVLQQRRRQIPYSSCDAPSGRTTPPPAAAPLPSPFYSPPSTPVNPKVATGEGHRKHLAMLERLSKRSSSSIGAPPSDSSAASLVEAFLSRFVGAKLVAESTLSVCRSDDAPHLWRLLRPPSITSIASSPRLPTRCSHTSAEPPSMLVKSAHAAVALPAPVVVVDPTLQDDAKRPREDAFLRYAVAPTKNGCRVCLPC